MKPRSRTWLVVVGVVYLLSALVVGLWPIPVDTDFRQFILTTFGRLHREGFPASIGYSTLEFTANIAFFVPIGVLLCLLLPRRLWWLAILSGVALSCVIELSQLILLPARFASWGDIAANSLGDVIGVLLVLAAGGVRRAFSSARPATSPTR